jgi:hypothetical protein
MSFDPSFLKAVHDIYAPVQGTERMAELLYFLIRFTRPRTVVEAGMGYTSPFIAKALRDNLNDWQNECKSLLNKTSKYLSDIATIPIEPSVSPIPALGFAACQPKETKLSTLRTEWMMDEPALSHPGYYVAEYAPRAYCFDNLSDPTSTARHVLQKLVDLGLQDVVSIRDGNFWTFDFTEVPEAVPIDMMWIDARLDVRNALSVIEGKHWDLINPNGGLLLIHCMLTNTGGQAIMKEFEWIQRQGAHRAFEMVGLLEPHKVLQNNVLIIRKITGVGYSQFESMLVSSAETTLENDARRLVESFQAKPARGRPAG